MTRLLIALCLSLCCSCDGFMANDYEVTITYKTGAIETLRGKFIIRDTSITVGTTIIPIDLIQRIETTETGEYDD